MKKSNDRFHFYLQDAGKALIVNRVFRIINIVTEKWDAKKNLEVVSSFIKNKDYKKVSDELGKTKSLMWKREKSLNMESYFSAKEILTTLLKA